MYFFRVTFNDDASIYHDGLTKRQAVLRYNRWVREMALLPIKEVKWGLV